MPRQINSRSIADNAIVTSHISTNAITSDHIDDGAIAAADIAAGAVTNTQGMVHAFVTDGTTGQLNWIDNVSALQDADGNDLYDSVIVGTDDMVFTVDANGHLIMTIS